MEKKISYLNRNFEDYRNALKEFSKKNYPDLAYTFSDAGIDSWMIDLNANIADNLSYHIDRVFQETDIDSAQKPESIRSIARSNGVKIPGPKGSMAEVRFSCTLPVSKTEGRFSEKHVDMSYAPIIKRGTLINSSDQIFEVMDDIDFSLQFDNNGQTDRTIIPIRDSNGNIIKYEVSKLAVVISGQSRIFSKKIYESDIKPFMEININGKNIMNIESIIVKDGNNFTSNPKYNEFYVKEENPKNFPGLTRFFEVDYLAQQHRWGECEDLNGNVIRKEYSYIDKEGNELPAYSITKGEWKPIVHKFITEHNETGVKIIFGPGLGADVDISDASDFSKYQITRMLRNDCLGELPKPNSVLYVLYREGGGDASNVAKNSINNIVYLDAEIGKSKSSNDKIVPIIKSSITVTNTIPSVSGKDAPNVKEMKNLIKYYKAAQERCVTLKDYKSRISMMPPKYGIPFRTGVIEENNKIMIYLLGIDFEGHLSTEIPDAIIRNLKEYLKEYRMINDYVEIKSGKIINISFDISVHTDKSYNSIDIKENIVNKVRDYIDVSRHEMGDNIYIGDLLKEISKVDGVINVAEIKVYNNRGKKYSKTEISENTEPNPDGSERFMVDLSDAENILHGDGDSMFEIKFPKLGSDINIITKPM